MTSAWHRVGARPQAGLRPALQHGAVWAGGEPRLANWDRGGGWCANISTGISWAEFCAEDRYTPGVYTSSVNMRQWVVDTLDSNM